MARGFGATYGVGASDLVTTSLTTHSSTQSYWIMAFENGHGGNSLGRFFDWTGAGIFDNHVNVANTLGYWRSAVSQFTWHWGAPSLSTILSLGASHDDSSTDNNPVVHQNGIKLTVGSGLTRTEGTAPFNSISSPLMIGGRSDTTRTFDGWLAEFAAWDCILTDAEFAALGKGVSPALIRPQSLVEYVPMLRSNVSYKLAAPTITGTTVQPHPRIIMPRRKHPPLVA